MARHRGRPDHSGHRLLARTGRAEARPAAPHDPVLTTATPRVRIPLTLRYISSAKRVRVSARSERVDGSDAARWIRGSRSYLAPSGPTRSARTAGWTRRPLRGTALSVMSTVVGGARRWPAERRERLRP